MNRRTAATARAVSLNVPRIGVLVLNIGFWTLIILIGRALCA